MKFKIDEIARSYFDPESLEHGYRFSPWVKEEDLFYKIFELDDGSPFLALIEKVRGEWILRILGDIVRDREADCLRLIIDSVGLSEDMGPVLEIARNDYILRKAIEGLPGYRLKSTLRPDEALFAAVISQNVSKAGYFRMLDEFKREWGIKVTIEGFTDYLFPDFKRIKHGDIMKFESKRLKYRAMQIKEIAEKVDLELFEKLRGTGENGVEELKRLRGVGEYTARATILYGYRDYTVPVVDGYILKIMSQLYFDGEKLTPSKFVRFAHEKWGNWCGLVIDYIIAWRQKDEEAN